MAVLTIRLPDEKHNRLKALAERRKISMNKLFEELSTQVLLMSKRKDHVAAVCPDASMRHWVYSIDFFI